MTVLTSLARARSVEVGRAVPTATRRHVHLSARPLVFVPLALAGEANAPLACLVGTAPDESTLLVVPQPRNRDLRFAFVTELAQIVLAYVDDHTVSMEADRDRAIYTSAPQLIVPNPGGVEFTRLLGRSTRFRRTDGDYAVHPYVPILGRWLTWFADNTERPVTSTMLALTSVLADHWATGQSALEDANLAALMGWIAPAPGLTGAQAAAQAEDPVRWPPAGPATDPEFDRLILAELIKAYDLSTEDGERTRATLALERALRSQLEPTWRLVWAALALLRALEPGSSVQRRWRQDRHDFTSQVEYWRDGGSPQPKVDTAVGAAGRLARLERDLDEYAAQRAADDELAMAELRLTGEAFAGTIVAADPTRLDTSGARRKLRPHVVLETSDPVRLEVGTAVRSATRPGQDAYVIAVAPGRLTIELTSGMGRSLTPAPGSVPVVGERLLYSSIVADSGRTAKLPSREETPWTHGGAPQSPGDPAAASLVDDDVEEWA